MTPQEIADAVHESWMNGSKRRGRGQLMTTHTERPDGRGRVMPLELKLRLRNKGIQCTEAEARAALEAMAAYGCAVYRPGSYVGGYAICDWQRRSEERRVGKGGRSRVWPECGTKT